MNLYQSQDMTSIWMILQLSGSGHAAALPIFDAHLHMFGWVFNLGCLQGRSHHCHTHLSHKIQGPLLEQASHQSLGGSRMSYRKIIRLVCSYFIATQVVSIVNRSCCLRAIQGSHVLSGLTRPASDHWTNHRYLSSQCEMDRMHNLASSSWHEFLPPAPAPLDTQKSWISPSRQPQKPEIKLIKCRTPMMAHCLFWVQAWTYCWTSSYFRSTGFLTYKLAHHFQIEAAAKPCQSLPGSSPVSNPSKKHIGELDWTDLWSSCCLEDGNLFVEKCTQVGPINF